MSENSPEDEVTFSADQMNHRLPNNTTPIAYDIYISTRIDEGIFDFNGSVEIEVDVLEESTNITLHQRGLSINSVKLTNENGSVIPALPPHYDPSTEFLTIFTINVKLYPNSTVYLTFNYNGTLNENLDGSSYENPEGKRVYVK